MPPEPSQGARPLSRELRLLLACTGTGVAGDKRIVIRQLLAEGIDWPLFAGKAVDHGLVSFAAHELATAAPDDLPADILDAFHVVTDATGRKGRALLAELARLLEALAAAGIEAIPFKGPVLAIQAFGDVGLREFRDLDFLVRDQDLARTIATLDRIGYRRRGERTPAQYDLIHRLQGQEIIFGEISGTAVEPHTRLTSLRMALDIDHAALWRRARRSDCGGHEFLTLAPEDTLLLLAVHGGKEMWWNLKWACDLAAFIASCPGLDWAVAAERAQAQGCRRMLLLAASLGHTYFGAPIPDAITNMMSADRVLAPMIRRIVSRWETDAPGFSPDNNLVSTDRLRLHDGIIRRGRYVARTVFLPGPHHVAAMPLPRRLAFAYTPVRLMHDLVGLPLWRAYRQTQNQLGRVPYALAWADVPLAVIPGSAATRLAIERHRRAQAEARRALAVAPNDPAAWRDLGDALFGLGRPRKAIGCYDKALAIVPHNTAIWKKRVAAMRATHQVRADDQPEPEDAETWAIHAGRLFSARNFAEAIEASDRALALDPENVAAACVGIHARQCACEWRQREADKVRVGEALRAGQPIIRPFYHRSLVDSEAESVAVARVAGRGLLRRGAAIWDAERYRHDRIRLAYCSTDFRDHVVADVMAGCFEHHDASRFETTAISMGPDDGGPTRRRIAAAFHRFIDAQTMGDAAVARLLRELEIDIVVDLNGWSGDCRPGLFARRPAPVQAAFLGYPGTTGMPFFDYILADRVVIPPAHRMHYAEQVVYLPHSFFPSDRTRRIAATPSRVDAGLPATGFVFASHNHDYKIGPEMFDIWMRLLQRIDGSVLWLRELNPAAMINLRREAVARGVAPERLVFAPRTARAEDHLARLRLADLFLDTLPYNAHATASDALWVGLPVVTCLGNTYPGRVAASLLLAIGMPELVTNSLAEYDALATALAQDPRRLAAIRARLVRNRESEPLFDTARFTRDLESAYATMWQRQQDGRPPAGFSVHHAAADADLPA